MSLCPFAEHKLIPPGSNDPAIVPRVAILHIAASGAPSLFDYFSDWSGGIESHFYVTWRGKIEQYRDTDYEADANWRANPFAVSIETQGWGGGLWSARQLAAIKRLLVWLQDEHAIPLRECKTWSGSGLGYHSGFEEWSPGPKVCPGAHRIAQFYDDLLPWAAAQPTPVQRFRDGVSQALEAAVRATPSSRAAAHALYGEIEAVLKGGPRK